VVWRVELTLVAGMVGGSGLGLGCYGFGRHFEELVNSIERIGLLDEYRMGSMCRTGIDGW
jgi:hypothetical protein